MKRIAFVFFAAVLLISCENVESVVQTHQYNERLSGDLSLDPVRAIVVQNQLGPVIIEGSSNSSGIGWFLDTWVISESPSAARPVFAQIRISLQTRNDTAYLGVEVPSEGSSCSSLLSLSLPNRIPCILRNIRGTGDVSYLQSDLVGENVATTTVRGHQGNCIISGTDGDATLQISLPDSGLCRVTLNTGNISLLIPAATSSILSAHSSQGTILLSGLVIGDSVRAQNSFTAKLGSGRGNILLSTGRGNIIVTGM